MFSTASATVAGMLSSDSKNMEISGRLTFADTAKMSSLTTQNLWVSKLTLSGLSVDATDDLAILKINQSLDMSSGRIEAMFVSVGFAGSMTPRLVVYDRSQLSRCGARPRLVHRRCRRTAGLDYQSGGMRVYGKSGIPL